MYSYNVVNVNVEDEGRTRWCCCCCGGGENGVSGGGGGSMTTRTDGEAAVGEASWVNMRSLHNL